MCSCFAHVAVAMTQGAEKNPIAPRDDATVVGPLAYVLPLKNLRLPTSGYAVGRLSHWLVELPNVACTDAAERWPPSWFGC